MKLQAYPPPQGTKQNSEHLHTCRVSVSYQAKENEKHIYKLNKFGFKKVKQKSLSEFTCFPDFCSIGVFAVFIHPLSLHLILWGSEGDPTWQWARDHQGEVPSPSQDKYMETNNHSWLWLPAQGEHANCTQGNLPLGLKRVQILINHIQTSVLRFLSCWCLASFKPSNTSDEWQAVHYTSTRINSLTLWWLSRFNSYSLTPLSSPCDAEGHPPPPVSIHHDTGPESQTLLRTSLQITHFILSPSLISLLRGWGGFGKHKSHDTPLIWLADQNCKWNQRQSQLQRARVVKRDDFGERSRAGDRCIAASLANYFQNGVWVLSVAGGATRRREEDGVGGASRRLTPRAAFSCVRAN